MKTLITTTLSILALVGLAMSLPASESPPAERLEFGLDLRGFDSMMPNEDLVRTATQQELTGAVARFVAYVERPHADPRPVFESSPRDVFIFATKGGRYVLRFSEPWSNWVGAY